MLVTASNLAQAEVMLGFLSQRGVVLPKSTDMRFIARVSKEGQLIGVVAFNGFNGRTCCMHCAGDGNWMSRELLRAAFDYPFVKCDVVQLFGMVAGNNVRALKLNRHLGFEVLHRIAGGWELGMDLVVMGMNRATCRWLGLAEVNREKQAA